MATAAQTFDSFFLLGSEPRHKEQNKQRQNSRATPSTGWVTGGVSVTTVSSPTGGAPNADIKGDHSENVQGGVGQGYTGWKSI